MQPIRQLHFTPIATSQTLTSKPMAKQSDEDPSRVMSVFFTESDGQTILNVAPGDHSCHRFIVPQACLAGLTSHLVDKMLKRK